MKFYVSVIRFILVNWSFAVSRFLPDIGRWVENKTNALVYDDVITVGQTRGKRLLKKRDKIILLCNSNTGVGLSVLKRNKIIILLQ